MFCAIIADMMCFEGKSALVVGGSGGIGFAVAEILLKNGADLTIHGRNVQKNMAAAEKLEESFPDSKVESLVFDFDSQNFGALKGSELEKSARNVDILCVCYGPFIQKPLEETKIEDWQKTALLDYALPGFLVSCALPSMKKNGFGRILLFGGTGTNFRSEFFTNAAYAGAKTGVGVLVQSVAAAFADSEITCNAILPGFTETEYLNEKSAGALKEKMPGKKLISLESVADCAEFLLKHSDLNGVLLRADRGWCRK